LSNPYFSTIVRIIQGALSDDLALRARRPRALRLALTGRLKNETGMNPAIRLLKIRTEVMLNDLDHWSDSEKFL